MTALSVCYRHCSRFRPLFLKNPEIEEIAHDVRAQLADEDVDRLPLSILSGISSLTVNGLSFDLWVSLDHPVTDHETGEQVCGLCEFDPGSGEDAVSLLVSPPGQGMTEELVLSTFAHELGHAVFDAPGWIVESRTSRGLFDEDARSTRQARRSTTNDPAHLQSSSSQDQSPFAQVGQTARATEMRIAEFRANEFMGSLLVPRRRLCNALIEMAPDFDVTITSPANLLGEADHLTVKAVRPDDASKLASLQRAIGERFGVHGRFIEVRMARYGLIGQTAC